MVREGLYWVNILGWHNLGFVSCAVELLAETSVHRWCNWNKTSTFWGKILQGKPYWNTRKSLLVSWRAGSSKALLSVLPCIKDAVLLYSESQDTKELWRKNVSVGLRAQDLWTHIFELLPLDTWYWAINFVGWVYSVEGVKHVRNMSRGYLGMADKPMK